MTKLTEEEWNKVKDIWLNYSDSQRTEELGKLGLKANFDLNTFETSWERIPKYTGEE